MARWLARRLIMTGVTFVGFTVLVFVLMRLAPVDPVDMLLYNIRKTGGLGATEIDALKATLRHELGLDQPIPVQYLIWVEEIIKRGSLGFSFSTGRPSLEMVVERIPPTLLLMGSALVIELVVGIPLGIVAALRRNRLTDYLISAFGLSAVAIPAFFLGLASIFLFSVELGWLPTSGMFTPGNPTVEPLDVLRHLILPACILGLAGVGPIIRYVRTGIIETLGKEYLVTARAKGLGRSGVVIRHALPNGLLPLITIIGLQAGGLLAGAFVVEQIFSWPGLGKLGLEAMLAEDYPVIQAFAVLTAAMVLFGNLFADLAYGVADPRIRLE